MAITGLIEKTVDLDRGVHMTPMNQLFATSDERAHTIRVQVFASGLPVFLDGAGVFGYFIRADDDTVVVLGKAYDNVVEMSLPESCYAVVGHFSLIVKATSGGDRKAVFWGDGYVTRASTDEVVDPGHVIPSLEELLARISEMESATNAANQAAQRAGTSAASADEAATGAREATEKALELTDRWDDVSLEYELLPPSEDPWAALEQTDHETKFKFGLPHSNLAYSTFEVDDEMQLIMHSPDGFSDIGFALTEDGYLEVVVN